VILRFIDYWPSAFSKKAIKGSRKNKFSGASAGRADARRRDAGDVVHRRGAATQQMPARRRAPQGCRLSKLQYSMSASRMIIKPERRQQNVK
jgi:hypothetical protein